MPVQSRAQADLLHAIADIQMVADAYPEQSAARKTYGRWCHRFPILVRTNGLCSAIAFLETKAGTQGSDRQFIETKAGTQGSDGRFLETKAATQGPDRQFLEHMAGVLGVAPAQASVDIAGWGVSQYIHKTRRLLEAAVYYKRFAVSILKVQVDAETEETAATEAGAP